MVHRISINKDPYEHLIDRAQELYHDRGWWPCKWIGLKQTPPSPFAAAFRRSFTLEKKTLIRAHVSADERYELFLDGTRIGRGSERGDQRNWFYETYELDLEKGDHILVARVWVMGLEAPSAQISIKFGFIFSPENPEFNGLVGSGHAPWEVKVLTGYTFRISDRLWGVGTGAKVSVDGSRFCWGFESGQGTDWEPATIYNAGLNGFVGIGGNDDHLLKPAPLPPMMEIPCHIGTVRFISNPPDDQTQKIAIKSSDDIVGEHSSWSMLINGKGSVTIPAHTRRRVLVDSDNYYCAYPFVRTSGGKGSTVRIKWDEALYIEPTFNSEIKENRNEIEGKYFFGIADTFMPDGGKNRLFETLWWEAGRYVEYFIETAEEVLYIEELGFRETRYPLEMESSFSADDQRLSDINPIMLRGLQMCSHETYMDCPYYEQLQYTGDTRLEILATYAITRDARLPRKALVLFDSSHHHNGLVNSAYPANFKHQIAPFSLWWVSMIHDYALWRGELDFVKGLMPGARHVIDHYINHIASDGFAQNLNGWNFMDWIRQDDWLTGVPPEGQYGVNSMINWQFVYTLTRMGELERMLGEHELAARYQRTASALSKRLRQVFWDENRGLYAETKDKKRFTEHTQCLAILSGMSVEDDILRMAKGLAEDTDLSRTTIYFSHYLLETFAKINRIDLFFKRLSEWFDLKKYGLKTTYEQYVNKTRSDCHAWGAHPLYHYFATILGIHPASPGFETVTITPRLGHLKEAKGKLVHPRGEIEVSFTQHAGVLSGTLKLPAGITGKLLLDNKTMDLHEGMNKFPD